MADIFDYIFYRVFKFYQKRDGTPQIYASGVLSVIQFFVLLSALAAIRLFINFPIPQKYFVIPVIFVLIGVNWMRYERNLDFKKFEERWGNEEIERKKTRGWLIVISLILSISFPILIGVLKHNIGIL
jgi:hypothetical protein